MSELTIQIDKLSEVDRGSAVVLKGSIDAKTVIPFQSKLNNVIEEGTNRIIIDMEHVRYVNSTGLGYLISLADKVGNEQGAVVLVNVQPKVKVVFDMLGLNAFFKIYSSRESAVNALLSGDSVNVNGDPRADTSTTPTLSLDEARRLSAPTPRMPSREAVVEPNVATPVAPAAEERAQVQIDCKLCNTTLILNGIGAYKCPRCYAMFEYSGQNGVAFVPNRALYPVQMTLNFTPECTDGLIGFISLFARRGSLTESTIHALQIEIRKLVEALHQLAYGGDENNIYHVLLILKESQIEARFVDYGKRIPDAALGPMRKAFDTMEVKAHPRGGNIISLTKKLS